MNQFENRIEGIIAPDMFEWDVGYEIDLNENEFVALLQTFIEDDVLEEFIEDANLDQIEAISAECNTISADDLCLISAE